jgi:hypothetical protein
VARKVTRGTHELTPAELRTFYGLADVLIPGGRGMPSASAADPTGGWVGRALTARPDLVDTISGLLADAAGRDPIAEVERLGRNDHDGFGALSLIASGAYLINPEVRSVISYPGQVARPIDPSEFAADLDGGLLDPVLERGAIYRRTPSQQ